ncbi:MAG: hypothetical protein SFU27_01810 [Thermonemataceae bacterium]|nr:hypothetical protein [Thermonemataceae bacterium]
MLKIALISNKFPPYPCGVGDYAYNLANSLATYEDNEVYIITPHWEEQTKKTFLRGLLKFSTWGITSTFRIIKSLKKQKIQITHIQNTSTKNIYYYIIPLFIRLLTKAKVIITIHEHTTKTKVGKLANLLSMFFCHHIIVQEKEYIPIFKSIFFLKKKEITFVSTPSNIPKSTLQQKDEEIKALRAKYMKNHQLLITYFGFLVEHKGVSDIFEVCEPTRDFILIISNFETFASPYSENIKNIINSPKWLNSSFCTGFIPAEAVADLLHVSDICIFPFKDGKKNRNASFSAAQLQGTYCITTHESLRGYQSDEHTYYASTNNIDELKKGIIFYLQQQLGKKYTEGDDNWYKLAASHKKIYQYYE